MYAKTKNVACHLCHVQSEKLQRADDDFIRRRPDNQFAVGGFEEREDVGRKLRVRVLQHQVAGERTRIADTGGGNLLQSN